MLEIRDVVFWTTHIHGNAGTRNDLELRDAGDLAILRVDDQRCVFEKMSDGKDGRPTMGYKPVGKTKEFWTHLYENRRGDLVDIDVID